ncbi:MFS general substrate transporter [Penicillium argentinense]|uniref:MFS general substrate transporter n=1 Tax=Penicillium argentinense TaxID=1131581 RepID=A0A9W9ENT3_9EURO|nr:MFS general substrate transporter [Penicillium argentinense]KAJ5085206.1 MFS general substrate transporter [Penicillium argentinense]
MSTDDATASVSDLNFSDSSSAHTPKTQSQLSKIADRQVLPLLVVAFASYQLDRTNIASCLTGGLASDIRVSQDSINLGNLLMFAGVIALEIPSNVILHQVGARWWIGGQVLVFGVVAALQIFICDRTGFLLTRTILGLCEAGFIPGSMFTLSTWYTREEITKRIAIFFFGMFGVEGIWTVVVSILLFFLLPERARYYPCSDVEKASEVAPSGSTSHRISLTVVWSTLADFKRWPHFIATACVFATWNPLTVYTPSIYTMLGFERVPANALAAIGNFITLPVVVFFAWLSDKSRKRGLAVIIAQTVYLFSLIVLRCSQPHVGKWSKFGLWTTANGLAVGYHPIHNAWIQMNSTTPEERSIGVAMC